LLTFHASISYDMEPVANRRHGAPSRRRNMVVDTTGWNRSTRDPRLTAAKAPVSARSTDAVELAVRGNRRRERRDDRQRRQVRAGAPLAAESRGIARRHRPDAEPG
jgi:hypothetical protein